MMTYEPLPLPHHVEYTINKWVLPTIKDSKLFVFDDLEAARRYCWYNFAIEEQLHKIKIFTCEVLNPTEKGYMCQYFYELAVVEFWRGKDKYKRSLLSNTVLCDAVKLIEEVK